MDAALAFRYGRSRLRRRRLCARLVFWHRNAYAQAIAHHLDGLFRRGVAMDLGVALVEACAPLLQRLRRELIREQALKRRAQLIALAGVAQVKLAREPRRRDGHALGLQF